ncbi:MAG: hypothetical protein K8R74_10715 [Bacteroidales bacterium]|nr:hypothetical protein [Bacteroidales bacterium]
MKKLVLLFSLVFIFGVIIQAQQDTIPEFTKDTIPKVTPEPEPEPAKEKKEKKPRSQKVFFGGAVGLSFGSYTRIAVYPQIGYRITSNLTAGIELGYIYISDTRYDNSTQNYSNYGASVFAQYRILKPVYVHVEYAAYNYLVNYITENREWVNFLFLGAGYIQKVGKATHIFAQVKFDVLQNENSPYGWDPLFRVGATVGF